jgi:polar amino acid transport system ATP-binding protein
MLTIKNVTKKFGSRTVLNNVSLEVQPGEIAVLLGSSGVGKSTLLRILNHLEELDAGTVELDGESLNDVFQKRAVGMVFQQFNLFEHMTVLENITFPLIKASGLSEKEATICAMKLLQHYELADKAPMSVQRLSGGQKQRLALVRTIAMQPRVICFDEPTSALDPLLTTFVAQSIQELANQGFIILVATHDIGLLQELNCTIYLMSNGSIVEKTSSKEFFANQENYPLIARFVRGK